MSKELKRSICLRNIYYNRYESCPNLEVSGRYIKSLHQVYSHLSDENDKIDCQYLINKCLSRHILFLQEAIINSLGKTPQIPSISLRLGHHLKDLSKSQYAVSDGKYSLVDVETLKNMEMLKKSVMLNKTLVLPCKVKSTNGNYHFNTQVIVTETNVLAYASHDFDHNESQKNVNHNVVISKLGKGIKQTIVKSNSQSVKN